MDPRVIDIPFLMRYILVNFIEESYKEKINTIKAMVKNSYFPEHIAQPLLKNPLLVIATPHGIGKYHFNCIGYTGH